MTGIVVSGAGIGTVIVPPLASWLISTTGWRTAYSAVGAVILILGVGAARLLKRSPAESGQAPYGNNHKAVGPKSAGCGARTYGLTFSEASRTRQFFLLVALYLCFGLTLQSIMAHIVSHATDLGITPISAANVVAIIGGTSIIGRLGMGIASDRLGSGISRVAGFAILFASFLWLQWTHELWAFQIFAVFFGFSMGGMIALESLSAADLFGLRAHGAILGIVVSVTIIGGAIGSLLAGRIFDITGSYDIAFRSFAAVSFVGLALSLLLKPARTRSSC